MAETGALIPPRRRALWRCLLVVFVLGSIGWLAWPTAGASDNSQQADDIARRFCTPIANEARVDDKERSAVEMKVDVPVNPPDPARPSRTVSIRQGDVVEFVLNSPLPGAVGVHGLSDIRPVREGQTIRIKFRAVYGGRFPLHFHGIDESHYELMALEIRP